MQPEANHFVVNVGDMLERWTHGRYVSNVHRVRSAGLKERLSAAFFFEPNVDALVSPIESLTPKTDGTSEFAPVVYGEWLSGKYKATGEVI